MKKLIFISLILLASCGKFTHKIQGVDKVKLDAPTDFKIGPDFEKAAKICDKRYGKGTEESEACFMDYRNYTKLKIAIDFEGIQLFCEKTYTNDKDVSGCMQDLIDLFDGLLKFGE